MKKFLIAYGFQHFPMAQEDIDQIARFDMVDGGFNWGTDISRIKTINPNCKILGYKDVIVMHSHHEDYPIVDAHEDWFLHDIDGNRLVNKFWGGEALDVGNKEYQTHYAKFVKQKCDQYGFAGVYADDVWEWVVPWHNTVWTVDESLIPPEYAETWHNRMLDFIQTVKGLLGNKLMILNTSGKSTDYIVAADGFHIEEFLKPERIERHMDVFFSWMNTGKVRWCQSTEDSEGNKPDRLFSLTAFLLGADAKSYWGYATAYYYPFDEYWGYPPEMDIDVGNPRGNHYQVEELLLGRDFDKAKVFVNFSETETYTVEVEETIYTLTPKSGVIAPWEAPPIGGPLTAILASGLFTASLIASAVRDGSRVK